MSTKSFFILFFMCCVCWSHAQINPSAKDSIKTAKDSIKKIEFVKQLGNGYLPISFVSLDLRYLVKFNQYEGFRTGLGGTTNDNLSEKFRLNGYLVYGFKDDAFKYSYGGGIRISPKTDTWINASHTYDLQETGSSNFLTDKRFFQLFEPRLLNINLFHYHRTTAVSVEHKFSNHLLSETQLAASYISPTYGYRYVLDGESYPDFDVTIAKMSLQWSPFSSYAMTNQKVTETKDGYPKFTLQFAQSIKGLLDSDFAFSKVDFRTIHRFIHSNTSFTEATVTSGLANGNVPLTHLYHAYPNNISKATIMQRFSVAGINSFETMYFNEFFSDKFTTLQVKHFFKPFKINEWFKPQLVLISRYAVGNMSHMDRHQNITFKTLEKGYSESGFEINKLLFGFGASFAYRYGGYHIPEFEDNFAFKFTFNMSL